MNLNMSSNEDGITDSPAVLNDLTCVDSGKVDSRLSSSTGTETTFSCTESNTASSTSTFKNDSYHIEIRNVVKSKLDPKEDAKKIKIIGMKGKSIKFPVKVSRRDKQ